MQQAQTQANAYFNLHVEGEGFLSRARHVPVRKGKPFLAVAIGAFHGQAGEYTFVNLDCKVVGSSAVSLIEDKLMNAVNDKAKKVKIGFRAADIYLDSYTLDKGERAGQVQTTVKGRLLKILCAEIDGQTVYVEESYSEKYAARSISGASQMTVRGMGYLARAIVKNNTVAYASVGAFHGSVDDVTYVNFDMKPEKVVADLIGAKLAASANDKEIKVLVGFTAQNPTVKSYDITQGEAKGQKGFVLSANLTALPWAKVKGECVHRVLQGGLSEARAKTGTQDSWA